jgi:imidazole glycerol-phosphate synthase subunit HisF
MLKKRLIPKLLLTKRNIGGIDMDILVTTKNYESRISIGDPLSQAKIYEANLADELLILAIDSIPLDENPALLTLIERMSEQLFMPLCVGGGVSTLKHFEELLNAGADKISVNSILLDNPGFVKKASQDFGSQCVVASIDYRVMDGKNLVFNHRKKIVTELDLFEFTSLLVDYGVGELHICNIDKDGSSIGIDLDIAAAINNSIDIPIIVSGGIGTAQDFVEGFTQTDCSAIAAGTYFTSQDQNPMQARSHISNANIPIRMGR